MSGISGGQAVGLTVRISAIVSAFSNLIAYCFKDQSPTVQQIFPLYLFCFVEKLFMLDTLVNSGHSLSREIIRLSLGLSVSQLSTRVGAFSCGYVARLTGDIRLERFNSVIPEIAGCGGNIQM